MRVFEHLHGISDVLHLKIPSYLSVDDDDLVKMHHSIASPTPTRTLTVHIPTS